MLGFLSEFLGVRIMINKFFLSAFTMIFFTFQAMAINCEQNIDLSSFHKDPKAFLNAPVLKLDENCKKSEYSYFKGSIVESQDFITAKDSFRKSLCHTDKKTGQRVCLKDIEAGEDVLEGRAPIQSVDRAENLVSSSTVVRNIKSLDQFTSGKVKKQPWSDWYWPIAVGQLSYRYADNSMLTAFQNSGLEGKEAWPWMQDWHQNNRPTNFVENLYLSPAEKYDILVGDSNFTFTRSMLSTGQSYYNRAGYVETWMGICHGWAPASYMLPRPIKTIEVTAVDGYTKVKFRPSDLKSLASQLWATGQQQTKIIGGRCNKKNPRTDRRTGRILDQECFDNNPGTWHLAVTNQLGRLQKTFVMDATYDYEVWNHPVTEYSYTYFNPKTMQEAELENSILPISKFSNDKFRRYRSRNAAYVVGIKMEVKYLVETMPSLNAFDDESTDAFNFAYYTYDLELDSNFNIIGGEWYTNKHPDFLWTPYEQSHAVSAVDSYLPSYLDLENLSLFSLKKYAPYASQRQQPVGKLVEALLEEASTVK